MPRYKLTIEYDGSVFAGWQRQDNAPSVQATLEAAAEALDGASAQVIGGADGCGRACNGVGRPSRSHKDDPRGQGA